MEEPYLSVAEAVAIITAHLQPIAEAVWRPLSQLVGGTLARPVSALRPLPPFDRAAMDGYALRSQDLPGRLKVVGTARAGGRVPFRVGPGEAARILTGAPLPPGADTVVEQEAVVRESEWVVLERAYPPGRNIMVQGSEAPAGAVVLEAGQRLTPLEVGLLAGLGVSGAWVVRPPRVLLAVNGDEAVMPGQPLRPGQIWDSNGPLLSAWLSALGAEVTGPVPLRDQPTAVRRFFLRTDLRPFDLIVTTGGVSVGDRDYIIQFLKASAELWFWRLDMHPGKAMAAASVAGKPVLALSGNPGAALMGWHLVVVPTLAYLMGGDWQPRQLLGRLARPYPKPTRETRYLRVQLSSDQEGRLWVDWGLGQGSDVISSWAFTDGLAVIPRRSPPLPREHPVEVWLLPQLGRGTYAWWGRALDKNFDLR